MRAYLTDEVDTPLALAARLGLSPAAHHDSTGDGRFARHPEARGCGHRPSGILGAMCLKVLGTADSRTRRGEPYPPADVAFFWQRAGDLAGELPEKLAAVVRDRRPSPELRRGMAGLVGRAGVYTLTGRLRAAAGFTARRNTVFQGLTSDGAKLALWRVWRAGYRVVNFVHDELLVEVPAGGDLTTHAGRIQTLMVDGMRAVLPDVAVGVEYAATTRWAKGAKATFDEAGRLVVSPAAGG